MNAWFISLVRIYLFQQKVENHFKVSFQQGDNDDR